MSLNDMINNKNVQLAIFDNDIVMEGVIAITPSYNIRCDVRGRERDIPHFHIMTPDHKVDFCVKLGVAEWFVHDAHINPPTSKDQIREIIDILSKPYKKDTSNTNYRELLIRWNRSNYAKVDETIPMPDYSTLNLKDAREMVKHVQKHGGVRFTGGN